MPSIGLIKKGMSRSEIDSVLSGLGDFVQIDHLVRFLKEPDTNQDTKKYSYLKLASIYEKKAMFFDASKAYDSAAIYCLNDQEKSAYYIKEAESLIKGGFFEQVEKSIQKASQGMSIQEKQNIYTKVKLLYKKQAEIYESQLKRSNAVRVYEKMLELKITDQEKAEIKAKLVELYEKLGKKKEYMLAGQGGQRRKTPWLN
ncbi:Uncharacterised protein [uncultured archaeon]|nr:Uncharacterised protein [uncultured archaeon]